MTHSWEDITLEEEGTSSGICDCCSHETIRVNGFLFDKFENWSAYNVSYTKNMPEHGAEFTIISGQWGEGTTAGDRYVIVLDFLPSSGFSIADNCLERKGSRTSTASNFIDREAIIGTEFSERLFMIVDAVYMKESRLNEIRNWENNA